MRRKTWALVALLGAVGSLSAATAAFAQKPVKTQMQIEYEKRRAQMAAEVDSTNRRLAELRGQRVELAARVENLVAQQYQERARALLMSNEANALQQLDSILVAAQDNLIEQRDRFRALGDAVKRRTNSVLVVLLRADSSSAQSLGPAELSIDNASAATRNYTAAANSALQLGAVDQLYRADVLPTSHSVRLQVTVNGQPMTQGVDVSAQGDMVTYVQFAVRNGQLVPTTWTARGTTPF